MTGNKTGEEAAMLAATYRRRLYDRALDQYGYVTTDDARALGVPPVERVAYGVYRFEDVPRTVRDQFMEAVLRVGPGAHLAGEAVLALHDLALVNPRRIRVASRRGARSKLPPTIELVRDDVPEGEVSVYEGTPAVTVARAIADCPGRVMRERLMDAVEEAERRGLLLRAEAAALRAELTAASVRQQERLNGA